jgi:hypothetical protein
VDRASEVGDEDDRSGQNRDEYEIAARVVRFDLRSELGYALADLSLGEVDVADPRIAR